MIQIATGLVCAFAVQFGPSAVPTAGIPFLITHGDTIKHLYDLPAEAREAMRNELGKTVAVGYKYGSFGLFWLDLWTWGGEYCLFEGDNYWSLTPAQAAELLKKPEKDLGKPFFYSYPPGLLVIGALVAFFGTRGFLRSPARRAKRLLGDVRYQQALEVFGRKPEGPEAEDTPQKRFAKAVASLESQGVKQSRAEDDLGFLLAVVSSAESTPENPAG